MFLTIKRGFDPGGTGATPKVAGVTGGGGIITAGGMAPKGGAVGKTSDGSGAGKPSTSSGGCSILVLL